MSDGSIVLVHGAWHGGWAWEPVAARLREAGRDVVAVDLPSAGPDPASLGDLTDDARAVGEVLDRVGPGTVVVGHSYGGQVVSEAAAGRHDVDHLVYVAAFLLDIGASLFGRVDGHLPDWVELVDGGALRPNRCNEIFYADVDPGTAAAAVGRLGLQSVASFTAELTGAAWRHIPTTYVVCEQDRAIPAAAQHEMSAAATNVHRLDSSHSPFLSMPDAVAGILLSV
jgi:pimeloyl-ACP methyl ester carboxylesterase